MPTRSPSLPPGDVEITFTGLCLIVPSATTGEFEVYSVNDPAQHSSVIYARCARTAPRCKYGYSSTPVPFGGEHDLRFLGPVGTSVMTLPASIPTIQPPQHLDPNVAALRAPNSSFVARVKLPFGGCDTIVGGDWTYGTARGPLAYSFKWKVAACTQVDQLQAHLTQIDASLKLKATDGAYRMLVANVTPIELPGNNGHVNVPPNAPPQHFHMYSQLLSPPSPLAAPTNAGGIVSYDTKDYCLGEGPPPPASRGSFIQCMIATASR